MTPDQLRVLGYLARYGHIEPVDPRSDPDAARAPVNVRDLGPFQGVLRELVEKFMPPGTAYTAENVARMVAMPRCGCPDVLTQGGVYGWPHKRPRFHYGASLPGFTLTDLRQTFTRAMQTWCDVCDLDFEVLLTTSRANVLVTSGVIDGPGNVLAWAHLPVGATPDTQLTVRFGTQERWTDTRSLSLLNTSIHEFGHVIGIPHLAMGNVMQPYASVSLVELQPGDIAAVRNIYGTRRNPEPPPTPPPPTPTPPPGDDDEYLHLVLPNGQRYRIVARRMDK